MANYNRVILIGNLTRDVELKYGTRGGAIAQLGLAVNRTWKTETGEKKEEVMFCDVKVFGKTAENCSQFLKKGRSVMVDGRLNLDTWEDKQTKQPRSKLGVIAEQVQFLSPAEGGERQTTRPAPAAPAGSPQKEDADNTVPF